MGNGNRSTFMLAIICAGLVHAGAFMGLTSLGNKVEMVMHEGGATELTMHRIQLAGVMEEQKGNAEQSAPEADVVEENEAPLETPEPEPEMPEAEPEPIVPEPAPIELPKPAPIEPSKEELIAAKKRAEHKVRRAEKVEQKPERRREKRPERKPERRHQKPAKKPQSSASAQVAQTAKSVYSEHEVSVLSKPMPGYPRAARQRRMQGTVALLVGINAGGTVSSVTVQRSSGHELLDREATRAAQGIRLRPYMINGVPTPIRVRIQYQFKM